MSLRQKLAHHRWAWGKSWQKTKADAKAIGWKAIYSLWRADKSRSGLRTLQLPGYAHPLFVRNGSSDSEVVRQVFARQEYGCIANETNVRTILDCGANIGCTTFFLLHRYPNAKAVVVEPDAGNMALCQKNLAPFGSRVVFVNAGVWSESAPMVVDRGTYRDGAEWSFQVRPAKAGEKADFVAKTVPDLLKAGGFETVDILKMDIEAAEETVFRAEPETWLPTVRTLVIELHGPTCEAAVTHALKDYTFQTETSGELTVYRGLKKAEVAPCT